ncbi:hypothetical protein [Arcobacter sp.]|uniref:hypothetical protein n=1 Tax=unclassified Arcobacter TaxID=2593671 RepID=UPI003AFF6CCE
MKDKIYYKSNDFMVTGAGYINTEINKTFPPETIKSTEYNVLIPSNKIKAFIHLFGAFFVFTIVPSLRNTVVPTELAYVIAPILVISALYHFFYTKIRVTFWLTNGNYGTVDFIGSKYARRFQKAINQMLEDYRAEKVAN